MVAMAARLTSTTTNSRCIKSPSSLVSSITSLLKTLNPQNPDPSPLNQFSPHLSSKLVIKVINNNQTNPNHALLFFNWASNPNPNPNNYSHTHKCYIAITDLLLSHGLFSKATHLLQSSDKFSDFTVSKLIKAHGERRQIKLAIHLFNQVKEREMGRCLFSCNAILGVLVKANRVNLARTIFDEIVKEGVVNLDVAIYTTMIRGLCKIGLIEDAEKLLDEMSCKPNLFTYTTLVDGFCKKGLMESALSLVTRMMESKDCMPNTVTYNTLIHGYCKKGELDEAKKCFDEMVSRNCKPNTITYTTLMNAYCKKGELDEAKKCLDEMVIQNCEPNTVTYSTLIDGYCKKGELDEAKKYFDEMVSRNCKPDIVTYTTLIEGYCKKGELDEAKKCLDEMVSRNGEPNAVTNNTLIDGYCKKGELDEAKKYFDEMVSPDTVPYTTLIDEYRKRSDETKKYLDEMLSRICKPNSDMYMTDRFYIFKTFIDGIGRKAN